MFMFGKSKTEKKLEQLEVDFKRLIDLCLKKSKEYTTECISNESSEIAKAYMIEIESLNEDLLNVSSRLESLEEKSENEKPVNKPWFDYKIIFNEETNQAEVSLDWNDAFIKKIKELKYPGNTDYEIAMNFLNHRIQTMEKEERADFE